LNIFNNLQEDHCSGSSRTRRITGGTISTFKLGHPLFDDGVLWWIPPNVSFRMAWISFGALPY